MGLCIDFVWFEFLFFHLLFLGELFRWGFDILFFSFTVFLVFYSRGVSPTAVVDQGFVPGADKGDDL